MQQTKPIPFERVDLVAEVTEWIRQQIFSGVYQVDTQLPSEGKMASQFGVSRNVMREAMRNLRTLGLVETSQGRRPRVKVADLESAKVPMEYLLRSSGNSLQDLLEVRVPLETEMAVLAAQRADDTIIKRLEGAIDSLEKSRTQEQRIAADIAFHNLLAEATGNAVFTLILGTVSGLLETFHKLKTFHRSRREVTVREHRDILDAIKRGDKEAARAAMVKHLEGARG